MSRPASSSAARPIAYAVLRMALANLSILKTGKARALRSSTLDVICQALSCQPGDILRFEP